MQAIRDAAQGAQNTVLSSERMQKSQANYKNSPRMFKETVTLIASKNSFTLPYETSGTHHVRNIRVKDPSMFSSTSKWRLEVGGSCMDTITCSAMPSLRKLYGITDSTVIPFHITSGEHMFLPSVIYHDQKIIYERVDNNSVEITVDVYASAEFVQPSIEHVYLLRNIECVFPELVLSHELKRLTQLFLPYSPTPITVPQEYRFPIVQCEQAYTHSCQTSSFTGPLWLNHPTSHIFIKSPKRLANLALRFNGMMWLVCDTEVYDDVYTIYLTANREIVSMENQGINLSRMDRVELRFEIVDFFDAPFDFQVWAVHANICVSQSGMMGLQYAS